MKRFDLLALGECMVEFYAAEPLASAPQLSKAFAGDAANALVMASRLGGRVGFVSRIGNDPFGAGLLEFLRREQVDTTYAPLVEGENGVYFISLLEGGEREFTYRRLGSAASQIQPEDLEEAYIADSKILLLSGITQAISPSAEATTLAAAQIAHKHGIKVAYDPNHRPKLWARRGGLLAAQVALQTLLPLVDCLLPSQPADFAVMGVSSAEDLSLIAPLVALKSGAEGVQLWESGKAARVAATPASTTLDSTGAGDAWNGSFLHHLAKGKPAAEAAALANAIAAKTLAFRGAIPPRHFLETA